MQVKIDTKEKFTVITPEEPHIYDNMAAKLAAMFVENLQKDVPNIILNLHSVSEIDDAAANSIAQAQQSYYEQNTSFVICELQPSVEAKLEELELLEFLNVTPTESEAWDIVQMEEIERELLGDDE